MKQTVVILVVLGLVAAMCAVLLVKILPNVLAGNEGDREITVLVTTRVIPAYTQLTKDDLEVDTLNLSDEPADYANPELYLTDLINVVGKVVSEDIPARQPLMKKMIEKDMTRATMMRKLTPGMRAYALKLSAEQIIGGLLKQGSFVDALVTFNTRGSSDKSKGEAVSRTFLENVEVIAVKGILGTSGPDTEGKTSGGPRRASSGGWTVTLLVDTAQAEALQLATERGTVTLTLRNPLYTDRVNSPGTVLDTSKVGDSSMFFDPPTEKEDEEEKGKAKLPGNAIAHLAGACRDQRAKGGIRLLHA